MSAFELGFINFVLRLDWFSVSSSVCMGQLLVCPALGNLRRALRCQWVAPHEGDRENLTRVSSEEASFKGH